MHVCSLLSVPHTSPHRRCMPHTYINSPMEAFYSEWLIQEERLLNELLSVPQDRPDLQIPVISRVLSHYAEYYNRKSQLAERDIFQVFAAYWLTPVERSFLWLGGLKPDMIFRFVPSALSNDQRREMEQLNTQMVQRQAELDIRMQHVEEMMTALMALAAVHGHVKNGEMRGETALRAAEMMRAVFDMADRLRKHVVTRIIEILDTAQRVQFLVSGANFHLRVRQFGLHLSARN